MIEDELRRYETMDEEMGTVTGDQMVETCRYIEHSFPAVAVLAGIGE